MDKSKVIIIFDEPRYFISYIKAKGLMVYPLFKELTFFFRILRRICFILKVPQSIWYDSWKNRLLSINTIIIFSNEHLLALNYIKRNNPHIRIIFYYWNPVRNSVDPDLLNNNICEKWSFDEADCKKFALNYNGTFYLNNIFLPKSEIQYDVIFVGQDKGRREDINQIKCELKSNQIITFFYVVDDDSGKRNYKGNSPPLSYAEYLKIVSQSKAILDYTQNGQAGLTLRPMEAIFFRKKLITNNLKIVNEKFYHPDNIFILGLDNITSLPKFLETPYQRIPLSHIEYYDFNNWMGRFDL